MGKRLLQAPTKLYDKIPRWLFLILACLMVEAFFWIGSFLGSILLIIPGMLFYFMRIGNFGNFFLPCIFNCFSFSLSQFS